MKHQFENSNSTWVRYSRYEWKTAANGKEYLTVGVDAKPQIYDPLKAYEDLVLNALYIGRLGMSKAEDSIIKEAIKANAKPVYGIKMLLYQGAESFKIWTGKTAPVDVMEKALRNTLNLE